MITNKELKNIIAEASWYLDHHFGCEINQTDYCTCGMIDAKEALRKAWKEL